MQVKEVDESQNTLGRKQGCVMSDYGWKIEACQGNVHRCKMREEHSFVAHGTTLTAQNEKGLQKLVNK